MYVDWKIPPKGDSGIYLRGNPQVQIWDSDTLGDNLADDRGTGSGGLWNNPKESKGKEPLVKADKPVGEWNTFHIVMKGDKVTVFLNGEKVVDDDAAGELLGARASRCRRRGRSSCSITATSCGSRISTSRNCRPTHRRAMTNEMRWLAATRSAARGSERSAARRG